MTLTRLLATTAAAQPHDPALICGARRLTFADLDQRSRRLARGFADLGIGPGDRVALWLPNIPLWWEAFFACARLGATAVAVNTRFRSGELADVLDRSGARALVLWLDFPRVDAREILSGIAPDALRALKTIVSHAEGTALPTSLRGIPVLDAAALFANGTCDADHATAESGSVMFTTSGTTSRPKLVLHTQRSLVCHARETVAAFGYGTPAATLMAVTPFCGVAGFGLPLAAVAAGRPIVFAPVFDEQQTLADIRTHAVTHTHANHEIVRRWLAIARGAEDFATLRLVNCGSRIATVLDEADRLGLPLVSIYGSSELQARFSRQRPGSAPDRRVEAGGFPISPDASIRARDPDTGRVLPHGEKGALEVRAPSMLAGYFADAEATARAIGADGFLNTGDFGWTRDDGSFVLEGRMGDVLKLSGFMTSPAEIEAMIAAHPTVAACQVVGVMTERGQAAVAFVQSRPGAAFDEPALRDYCRRVMARYKVPLRLFPVAAFPMTEGANAPKVRKTELQARAQVLLQDG